jgi:hypothetical protein
MDGRVNNGGYREGSGRKSKNEEDDLRAKLSPMDDNALQSLKTGIEACDFQFVKLFMEYRYGKPKETKDVNHTNAGEPFNLKDLICFTGGES